MNVLICNERLLFRFGVDRVMLMLAKALVAQGCKVELLCLKADERVKKQFKGNVTELEEARGLGIKEAEYCCATYLRRKIEAQDKSQSPDVIITGGWPFFCTAFVAKQHQISAAFIDAGAVPHFDLRESARNIQTTLRKVRAASLPHFSRVLPISNFIRDSQTVLDRGHLDGVKIVRLGVDHFSQNLFDAADKNNERTILARLKKLKKSGVKLVINLGRYEEGGYKNSSQVFKIFKEATRNVGDAKLVILSHRSDLKNTRRNLSSVEAVGSVSDQTLVDIMKLADVGVSVSLWEGFNLPIGEMQLLGKVVLAYNIGAHGEVIAHPWCLSQSRREFAHKLTRALGNEIPDDVKIAVRNWHKEKQFTWSHATDKYLKLIQSMANDLPKKSKNENLSVLVDVTNASADEANSGVMRVTRRLLAEWQKFKAIELTFVRWQKESRSYVLLNSAQARLLASYSGPVDVLAQMIAHMQINQAGDFETDTFVGSLQEPILFMPEIALDGSILERMDWAKERCIPVSAILHDIIPASHPHFCDPQIVEGFPDYLSALSRTERITAVSNYSLNEFTQYCSRNGLPRPPGSKRVWLPGQFGDHARQEKLLTNKMQSDACQIVCVSTIEPRKNHMRVIEAFQKVQLKLENSNLKLLLIGNSYAGKPGYSNQVAAAIAASPSIEWLGFRSDDEIAAAVSQARFTVFGSLLEGFGLPVLESLWLGTPCMCHDSGVMKEVAKEGGCLTVDMEDVDAIASGMEQLITDNELVGRLSREAASRPISTWEEYALQLGRHALGIRPHQVTSIQPPSAITLNQEIQKRANSLATKVGTVSAFSEFLAAQTGTRAAGSFAPMKLSKAINMLKRFKNSGSRIFNRETLRKCLRKAGL